jgi:hypothetical protein
MEGLDHATGTSLSDYWQWPRCAAFPALFFPAESPGFRLEPLRIIPAAQNPCAGGDAYPGSYQ